MTAKTEAPTRTLTFVNMSAEIHVHKAGCADLGKGKYRYEASRWDEDCADRRDIVNAIYGPDAGSFYDEAGLTEADWEQYDCDIIVMPCVGTLPHDLGSRFDESISTTTTIENTTTEREITMNTKTNTAAGFVVEFIDKGVWHVVDRSTDEIVGVYSGRAAARAAVAKMKADAPVEQVVEQVVEQPKKVDPLQEISDKIIAKKAAGEYAKEKKAAKSSKASKSSTPKAEKVERTPAPSAFALRKRAANFDALRDEKGNLPAGLVDAYKPRGGFGIVGLYFTTAASFDVSQVSTSYVLRCEEHGDLREVGDKREGRYAASQVLAWSPACAALAKQREKDAAKAEKGSKA
jgi:hypothetical protein